MCAAEVPNVDDCQPNAITKADNFCWLHCCCKAENKGAAVADAVDGLLLSAPIQSKAFQQESGNFPAWEFPPPQRASGATCDFALQNEDPRVTFMGSQARARTLNVNDWVTPRPMLPEGVIVTGLYVSVYAYGGTSSTCVIDRGRIQLDNSGRDVALTQFVLAESTPRVRRYGFLFTKQNLRLPSSATLSRSSLSDFLSLSLNFTRTSQGSCHVDCIEVQFVYENPILTLPLTESVMSTAPTADAMPTNVSTSTATPMPTTSLLVTSSMDGLLTVPLDLLLGVAGGVVLLCALLILLIVCVLRKRNRERNDAKRADIAKQVELDGGARGNIYQSPPLARFSKLAEVSVGEYQNPEVSIGQYKNPEQVSPAGGEYNVAEFTDAPLPKERKPTVIQPKSSEPKERKKTFIQSGEAGGLYQSFQLTESSTDLKYVDLPEETAGKTEAKNPVVYETFDEPNQ